MQTNFISEQYTAITRDLDRLATLIRRACPIATPVSRPSHPRPKAPKASLQPTLLSWNKPGWVHKLKSALPKAIYELLELAYSVVAYRQLKTAAAEFKPDFIYERYNLFLLSGACSNEIWGFPLLLEVNSPLAYERSQQRWAFPKAIGKLREHLKDYLTHSSTNDSGTT